VADAYFREHPGRTPRTIQPDDVFTLTVPTDAFVVHWQEERQESFGHPARVREYVSERGDRLRYYLTDPFPVRYELESADAPGRGVVHFHRDLAFFLNTRRTDPLRLAQLVYRVPDPDIFQVETMRRLAESAQLGVETTLDLDRTNLYLDPVRAALPDALRMETIAEPERAHLQRAVFGPDADVPFLAIDDSLGKRTELGGLLDGQVFRILYDWDGTVRVFYRTGPDDTLGKRDPYSLRENERWADVYARFAPAGSQPIKWGPGEPSDWEPFPTARDPTQRDPNSYDYLATGRVVLLTFKPIRFDFDLQAQAQFATFLAETRQRYRDYLNLAFQALDTFQAGLSPSPSGRGMG
jgi:hypothetical protein